MKMISPMSAEEEIKLRRGISLSLLFFSFIFIVEVVDETFTKLNIGFDGSVITSEEVCFGVEPGTKCYWEYVLLNAEGEKISLQGGMAGLGLEKGIAKGTSLKKDKWTYSYYVNSRKEKIINHSTFYLFPITIMVLFSFFFSRKEIRAYLEQKKR